MLPGLYHVFLSFHLLQHTNEKKLHLLISEILDNSYLYTLTVIVYNDIKHCLILHSRQSHCKMTHTLEMAW